jgi:23S rRNA (adenine2503-C2)-methyltransferase
MKATQAHKDATRRVTKLVFEDRAAIAETVACKGGVVCFSVQSGCPIGCSFCGTGNHFVRDLTTGEMLRQIDVAKKYTGHHGEHKILAMSMGEPMLNWEAVREVALECLNKGHEFVVSTIGVDDKHILYDILEIADEYPKFGLQLSLLAIHNEPRLQFFRGENLPELLGIRELISFGRMFTGASRNKAYFNYIIRQDAPRNVAEFLAENLYKMHLTVTPMNYTKIHKKASTWYAQNLADRVKMLSMNSVETSVCDCLGQASIGAGCGQLRYVQKKFAQLKGAA